MKDIFLNEDNDLEVGTDLRLTVDNESISQRLSMRLKTYRGEWFLNTEFGTPYYQQVLLKGTTQALADTIFKTVILDTPGVVRISSFTSELDRTTRRYTLNFTVVTDTQLEVETEVVL